jgi:hypothetical protein
MPERVPEELSESPAGGDPELTDQEYGAVPPVAARDCE